MFRIVLPSLVALVAVVTATSSGRRPQPHAFFSVPGASRATVRAGIAIVGTGGAAALDRVTALDSATGQFIVVTRPVCPEKTCAPLDSASGAIAPAAVARLFALIEREHVFSMRDDYGACEQCGDDAASYATTVQANGRRKVITSDGALTPLVLGRVHVALAEAIRGARGDD